MTGQLTVKPKWRRDRDVAIDTEQRRKSAATVFSVFNGPSVVPSGTIAAADRLHIGWSYAGIAAATPAVAGGRRRGAVAWMVMYSNVGESWVLLLLGGLRGYM